ncbi:lycopene cyclase family protein [Pseudovibrio exalbescens]|uniref:lycopene cyclase family protein n=1 Tax=Pseudovibrio exalbescens TaxID=197461 RepID=UPI0023669CDA|nr:lycopene cyclase family protein [Pseudovibrio exalbescens]MDD7911494.1 lycopene cyclase family protein [Pseudovibrio exalbescens]
MQLPDMADVVILGGGCAGLALARCLAEGNAALDVHVFEARDHYEDDRTWCFFEDGEHAFSALVSKRWRTWRFSDAGCSLSHHGQRFTYACLRSIDYYRHCTALIEAAPRVHLHGGAKVLGCIEGSEDVLVQGEGWQLRARYVIDTRPSALTGRLPESVLWQQFRGVEIELDASAGRDPDAVELMARMRADAGGFRFLYVLPLSRTRLLVETTRFAAQPVSPGSLQADLKEDLDAYLGSSRFEVVRTEQGAIPMGLRTKPSQTARMTYAGQVAGAVRPSTGYGFRRIQSWAHACATALLEGGMPPAPAQDPLHRRAMDAIFLEAVANAPHRAPNYFMRIAKQLTADQFAAFMSGQETLPGVLRLISALPPVPFLRSAGRQCAAQLRFSDGVRS